jgi:nicotinate-nucleotide adenylyltransferase
MTRRKRIFFHLPKTGMAARNKKFISRSPNVDLKGSAAVVEHIDIQSKLMQRIALFGGTFDPVHAGHLMVAQTAREEWSLARLFFIPAAQSPFKPERQPTCPAERLMLLRLALAGKEWCEVDEQEVKRGGLSYTIDTVRAYSNKFPEAQLFYLIGSDHVVQLPKWREAENLARAVEFLVIPRPGQNEALIPPPFRGSMLKGFPIGVSSSQIRQRVAKGLPIDHLVPFAVAEAIRNNRLYL